ncbi:MAG: efflux RND transporter permease subunit [Planctomycetota bacterium]|jgi:HAE1 family hydrophobic/amphiphilic exporter-1
MLSRFFIRRPIFASVVSIVLVVLGLASLPALPIEQTPNITPPTISVTASYPGASAQVVAETVAQQIESQVNGVEGMIYMSSNCTSDGLYALTVSFEVGTDVDEATVLVQNRVSIAIPSLPDEVQRQGVVVQKKSSAIVLMLALTSPEETYGPLFISNYINTNVLDVLKRVPGVGSVSIFGARDFGMRIWLDPDKLTARGLTTNDVVGAIRSQNVQVAAGRIGAAPAPAQTAFTLTASTQGRLTEPEQFENLLVKVGENGATVLLRDVARIELGAQNYDIGARFDGRDAVALGIYQQPGANALDIAEGIRSTMDRLAESFPEDLRYEVAFDTTGFIEASIEEVIITLLEAIALVVLTVYLFLQDIRTTIIPTITIPVALIGTFAVMLAFGMSLNTLSLFGIVLAIGIVVDDAILVVENVMRIIEEEGLDAKAATEKAMEQITGPVIATTLVLLAVFVPTAMLSGITGQLYQQFSITIAVSTLLSSVNALTLSPALCGILLRAPSGKKNIFFRAFDRVLDTFRIGYVGVGAFLCRRLVIGLVLFAGIVGLAGYSAKKLPTGFLPNEDQGYLFAQVVLPEGATVERTGEALGRIGGSTRELAGVAHVLEINGFAILEGANSTNSGTMFISLDPWEERDMRTRNVGVIARQLTTNIHAEPACAGFAFPPPPIMGLGTATGFDLRLEDREGAGFSALEQVANDLVDAAEQDPRLTRMKSAFRTDTPQIYLDIDREKTQRLGVPLNDLFATLQTNLGSAYVNDFSKFGRTYRVMAQADAAFRARIDDIQALRVRTKNGDMVPVSTLLTVRETAGPRTVFRYNNYVATSISGTGTGGVSTGEAIQAMAAIATPRLPSSMGFEWTGVSYQEANAGSEAIVIFGLALLFVFLFLAAQYESWSAPLAVLLNVPIAILGALGMTLIIGLDNNVYTQIGFVLLIGLAAKNAIMIVEFAREQVAAGSTVLEAARNATHMRFRAILMTAMSFILGVLPLLLASGAGAMSRRCLGSAVFGGMTLATVLGIVMIPMLYTFVARVFERRA